MKIRHLVETSLAFLAQAFVLNKLWMQAFQTAAYIINLMPTNLLKYQSPIQVLFQQTPNYHHLKVFGCLCFPSLRPYMSHKLSYRSIPCVFLRYAPFRKGYICLEHKSSRFYISRSVLFHEHKFPFCDSPNFSSSSINNSSSSLPPTLISLPSASKFNVNPLPSPFTDPLPAPINIPYLS